jgi:hypothetical protein
MGIASHLSKKVLQHQFKHLQRRFPGGSLGDCIGETIGLRAAVPIGGVDNGVIPDDPPLSLLDLDGVMGGDPAGLEAEAASDVSLLENAG